MIDKTNIKKSFYGQFIPNYCKRNRMTIYGNITPQRKQFSSKPINRKNQR